MKLRLTGLPKEISKMMSLLQKLYVYDDIDLISISDVYPCRNSKEERLYVEVKVSTEKNSTI